MWTDVLSHFPQVWPLVCATLLVTGPALWVVIAAPSLWQHSKKDQLGLLNTCCWFTTTLFLRQCKNEYLRKLNLAESLLAVSYWTI